MPKRFSTRLLTGAKNNILINVCQQLRRKTKADPHRLTAHHTLSCLISMLHAYLFFGKFSYLHGLIRTYTLINFVGKILPILLKRVGKIILCLVPTRLLGPKYTFIIFQEIVPPTPLFGTHAY